MQITENVIYFKKWLNINKIRYTHYNDTITVHLKNHSYGYLLTSIEKRLKKDNKQFRISKEKR